MKGALEEADVFIYSFDILIISKVSEYMGLSEIKNRQWAIFKCSAKQGDGVQEGMEWLANVLSNQK